MAKRLTLTTLIRSVDDCLDKYYGNKTRTPLELLNEIVEDLNKLLTSRCTTVLGGGKHKGRRCLRDSNRIRGNGEKCGRHNKISLDNGSAPLSPTEDKLKEIDTTTKDTYFEDQISVTENMNNFDRGDSSKPKFAITAFKHISQDYYPDPVKELQHLYDNVYLDNMNTVVIKNNESTTDHKWTLVCKFIQDKGVLSGFTDTILSELERQKSINYYNYEIDESRIGDKSRLVRVILDRKESISNKGQSQIKTTAPLVTSNYANDNPSTPLDKARYYNKYSRVPKIQLDDERLMSVDEFVKFNNYLNGNLISNRI